LKRKSCNKIAKKWSEAKKLKKNSEQNGFDAKRSKQNNEKKEFFVLLLRRKGSSKIAKKLKHIFSSGKTSENEAKQDAFRFILFRSENLKKSDTRYRYFLKQDILEQR
jgi:hypothetical protein